MANFSYIAPIVVLTPLCLLIITLCAIGYKQSQKNSANILQMRQNVLQIVKDALGDFSVPEFVPRPSSSGLKMASYSLVVCIAASSIYLAIYLIGVYTAQKIWPNDISKPAIFTLTSLFTATLLAMGILPLIQRFLLFSNPSRAFSNWESGLYNTITFLKAVFILAQFIACMILPFLIATQNPLLCLVVVVYYMMLFLIWYSSSRKSTYLAQSWLNSALSRANYDEALRRAEYLATKFSRTPATLYSVGTVLLFAGRLEEAEAMLYQSMLGILKTGQILPVVLINYASVLLKLSRYEQATQILVGAIKLDPKNGHAYCGLAEAYLYQGINTQEALSILESFLKQQKREPRQLEQRYTISLVLADKAWVLAQAANHSNAEIALRQALEIRNKEFKPGLAGLYYRCGRITSLMGDQKRAKSYLTYAQSIDPQGYYGNLSRQTLEEMKQVA